jgi:hypothetical protein
MSPLSRPLRQPLASSELAAALASCRRAFLAIALFSGMSNLLMLTGALFMLEIYDRVLPSRSVPTLVALLILAAGLYAAQGIIDAIRSRILVRVGHSLDEAMSLRVYDAIVRLPLKIGGKGEGAQPVRDLDSVRAFLSGAGPVALFDLPWMPIYLAIRQDQGDGADREGTRRRARFVGKKPGPAQPAHVAATRGSAARRRARPAHCRRRGGQGQDCRDRAANSPA